MRFPATIRALIVLIITAFSWLRLIGGWQTWPLLTEALGLPRAQYLLVSGAFWGLAGMVLLAFWGYKESAERWMTGAALLYALWYWLDRLLFRPPSADWPFAALITGLFLIPFLWSKGPQMNTGEEGKNHR